MNWLLELMKRFEPLFKDGGKLRAVKPVYDATEHFFFASPEETPGASHIRDPLDVKRYMSMVIVALAPALVASVYLFGLRVLAVIAVSYAVGGTVEVIFAVIRKEEINEGFLVTGLIFPMVLPPGLPLWMVGVGVAFGVIVGKELFGGTGRNLFNPALVGRCFLALSYPAAMTANWISPGSGVMGRALAFVTSADVDAMTSATPLVLTKQGAPPALADLFLGTVPGCIGETSALAIIAGGLFLLFVRVASWRTVAGMLGSFAALTWILRIALPGQIAPVAVHLFAGGLLFGAFFMATDPVTSPMTGGGKWAYGAIIGLTTVLMRNFTGYVEGVMFAILLGNIVAPILDEVVIGMRIRRLANEG